MARWLTSLLLLAALPALGDHRLYLAGQYDFGAKRGFYLDFENSAPREGGACRLATLRLILGAADGKDWRFVSRQGPWGLDRVYRAKAVVSATNGRLWLDGALVGDTGGGFVPAPGPLTFNEVPGWAADAAEYVLRQLSVKVSGPSGVVLERTIGSGKGLPPALALFAPLQGMSAPLRLEAGQEVTIEVTFTIGAYPSLRSLSPMVDRYGQSVHASWPDKVKSDADLKRSTREEAARAKRWTPSSAFDRYGGWKQAGWKERPTGFFRVARRNGVWWLVSPEGNPCFYTGVNSLPGTVWERTPVTGREFLYEWLPPRTGPMAAAWHKGDWGVRNGPETVAIQAANMVRKYGDRWEQAAINAAARRVRQWGFCGGGKWGSVPGLVYVPVLGRWDVPYLVRHPDIYDPSVRALFREALRKQIEPERRNPFVLGWSLGNEYDEIVTKAEVQEILGKPASTPARRELIRWAIKTLYGGNAAMAARAWNVADTTEASVLAGQPALPERDLKRVRLEYARAYYEFVYRTVKELDPNHLYLGFWIVPGWWENADDWRVSAPYCDVIGYDRYSHEFMDATMAALVKQSGKPILCGEFSFPPTYRGERGFGVYGANVPDEAAAGDAYAKWVTSAARNPHCVGVIWFQYRDQPLTGRGPGQGAELVYGEHYAFGVVDLCDRPKYPLVERMRKVNLAAPAIRARIGIARRPAEPPTRP